MNIPAPIENSAPGIIMTGSITRLEVFETQPTNVANVIPGGAVGSNWGVHLSWEMDGLAANSPLLMPNFYHVTVYLEGLGPGANEFALPATPFLVNYGGPGGGNPGGVMVAANVRTWDFSIPITAALNPIPAGLYKLGIVIQLFAPPDPPGTPLPIAGFVDGPLVQFTQ